MAWPYSLICPNDPIMKTRVSRSKDYVPFQDELVLDHHIALIAKLQSYSETERIRVSGDVSALSLPPQ